MKNAIQNATLFYDYQQKDIETIFTNIERKPNQKLVYQLPTGGGKTMIFSEITRKYLSQYDKQVMILTHRNELCKQTSTTLKKLTVQNKIIGSKTKKFKTNASCYVAMVETLRNRIKEKKINTKNVGLLIIDEAHHNSFRKLSKKFKNAFIIGATATPFSSDVSKPMNAYYDSLITGESIANLIDNGFLAKPKSYEYEIELNTLKTGIHGDFTVSSSNELYGSNVMQDLLLQAYRDNADGKKTLIFNNGIAVSKQVEENFKTAGIPVRHLDNKTTAEERKEILQWFKKTKNAVLTSVSILTTGFDEPTVKHIILNRATTSITLYHQMVGRGARRLKSKKTFGITDLGNNIQRFGAWEAPLDWKYIFEYPDDFAKQLRYQVVSTSSSQSNAITAEMRSHFPKTLELTFDIDSHFQEALDMDKKHKTVIQESIRQQVKMCLDNGESLSHALELAAILHPEVVWRVKQYVKCLESASPSYKNWLMEDYQNRLEGLIKKLYPKIHAVD
ncbi:DEAD/DEAH box helicase [Flavobacterium sp. 7A]|uniref:DEAD/DEAH box helicase n=1 Tax=Flavobacterium sp. 7A TaxID=2940571 RepID=UPI002227960B|nr:DEAD/DEAH box helicase [Flavobacterium sp. 7A]MCW2120680.1 superfamily II DNA or RNA helicase [Flavobacterium sp. 7A]